MDSATIADVGNLEHLGLFEYTGISGHNLCCAPCGVAPNAGYSHTGSEAVQCWWTADIVENGNSQLYAKRKGGPRRGSRLTQGVDIDGKRRHAFGTKKQSGDSVLGIPRI
jgi:hypothetical protein